MNNPDLKLDSSKLFWFSKIGTRDSFSRIAESILPILKSRYNFTLHTIIPPNLQLSPENEELFEKILRMGQDINEGGLKLDEKEFSSLLKERTLASQMKFIVLQVLAHCKAESIRTLLITMGVYEADWFMEVMESVKNTEFAFLLKDLDVVLYVPFDYLPSNDSIKYLLKADKIITTVPYLVDTLALDDWIGHANDPRFKKLGTRTKLIGIANAMRGRFWNGEPIKESDIIVLNANLFGERKRIDITIKAFEHALDYFEHDKRIGSLRLWLHGGYDESLDSVISERVRKVLITSNKIRTSELNLIYNICQIGINTSWGEGWSLTNCEHAVTGAIQVVPDWLACRFHFGQGRGVLIDVEETETTNEGGKKVITGIPKQHNANLSLREAIIQVIYKEYNPVLTMKYLNQYTWEAAAEKLNILLNAETKESSETEGPEGTEATNS